MPDMENMSPEEIKKLMEQMRQAEYEGLSQEEIQAKKREKETRKRENIILLEDTLSLCNKEFSAKEQKDLSDIRVFLPDEIAGISSFPSQERSDHSSSFACENTDALSLAHKRYLTLSDGNKNAGGRVLVLNLASATRPGGAVREGANGQEEDLCRKTSLLLSLESAEAGRYYEFNKNLHTRLGSDAVMISPRVIVLRDGDNGIREDPFEISVMSCSAPMVRLGLEKKTQEEYQDLLYNRIDGMLRCAATLGYKNLVLGAFGCGAFGNDAALVSDAFAKTHNGPAAGCFSHVDFAVLCTNGKEYNYQEFHRNFGG